MLQKGYQSQLSVDYSSILKFCPCSPEETKLTDKGQIKFQKVYQNSKISCKVMTTNTTIISQFFQELFQFI